MITLLLLSLVVVAGVAGYAAIKKYQRKVVRESLERPPTADEYFEQVGKEALAEAKTEVEAIVKALAGDMKRAGLTAPKPLKKKGKSFKKKQKSIKKPQNKKKV